MAPPSLFTEAHLAIIKEEFNNGKTDTQIAEVIKTKTGLIVTRKQVEKKRANLGLKRAQAGHQCLFTPEQDDIIKVESKNGKTDKEIAKVIKTKTGSSFGAGQIEGRRNTLGVWKRTITTLGPSQLLNYGDLMLAAKEKDGTSIKTSHAMVNGTCAGLSSVATGAELCYVTALKYSAMAKNGDAKPAAKEPSMTKGAIRARSVRGKLKRRNEEAACEERAAENLAGLKSCGDEENDENDRGGFL